MYKPDTKSQQAKWAAGPIGSIETRMAQAREWMRTNGIKPIERRESLSDAHEQR